MPSAEQQDKQARQEKLEGSSFTASTTLHVDTALSLYKLTRSQSFWETKQDTRCLVGWGNNTVVVAFRGTASMKNALADLQVCPLLYFTTSWSSSLSLLSIICLHASNAANARQCYRKSTMICSIHYAIAFAMAIQSKCFRLELIAGLKSLNIRHLYLLLPTVLHVVSYPHATLPTLSMACSPPKDSCFNSNEEGAML